MDERKLRELASLAFLERKENVLLLGPPGVGKTHLAIALGTEAIVAQFQRARDENKLKERHGLMVKPKLLVLDEMAISRSIPSPPPACPSWSRSVTRRDRSS